MKNNIYKGSKLEIKTVLFMYGIIYFSEKYESKVIGFPIKQTTPTLPPHPHSCLLRGENGITHCNRNPWRGGA